MAKSNYPRKPRPKTRAEFYAREEQVFEEMASAWRGLGPAMMLLPGACGPTWSIKDVINHTAAWQEAALRVIPELLAGRKAGAGHGTDRFNAIHYAEDKDRPLQESLDRLEKSRRELLALIASVPDHLLLDPDCRVGWWIKYNTYGHYSGHVFDLHAFRQTHSG